MRSRLILIMFGIILLINVTFTVKASQFDTMLFMYGVVRGSLEFPAEAHPTDTITYDLTLVADSEVTIINFTLGISGLVGGKWQELQKEQIALYPMTQGENLTRQVSVYLPQNMSERLHCIIEVSTDKGSGNAAFHSTYIRTTGYAELLNLYGALLVNHNTLLAVYNQLLSDYDALNSTYSSIMIEYAELQANYNSLNSSYQSLMASHNSLTIHLDSLKDDHTYIKAKYDASIGELSIVRSLVYVLSITTVIFAATTVYLRKKAPYILLRKETAVRPGNE